MSALTLLAFLFFLNILQNCLREQTEKDTTVMMMMQPAIASQAKDPGEEQVELIKNQFRKRRDANVDNFGKMDENAFWAEEITTRHSRTLLQTQDEDDSDRESYKATSQGNRQTKFIHNYKDIDSNNWVNKLSQLSNKELENQRIKTESFNLFWKDNKLVSAKENQKLKLETLPKIKINKLIKSPILSDVKDIPKIRKVKNKDKTTTEGSEIKSVEFETERAKTKIADFQDFVINVPDEEKLKSKPTEENVVQTHEATSIKPEEIENTSHIRNYIVKSTENINLIDEKINKKEKPKKYKNSKGTDRNFDKVQFNRPEEFVETTNIELVGQVGTPSVFQEHSTVINTPRSRRSDFVSTTTSSETNENKNSNQVQTQTPALGLDLNTYQTYPVYANPTQMYYNHRYGSHVLRENKTVEIVTPETTGKPEIVEVKRDPSEITITTEAPVYYPVYTTKAHVKYPHYDKMKNRNRYPNHQKYYPTKSRYPVEYKYQYNPYRKQALHDPGYYLRDEYYPMSVVGKYPGTNEEEVGFNLIKFVWTMLTAFARPLARLVPTFGKVGPAEPQCYDLLVCEAHRVSKFVGPTAEALASTFR